MARGPQDEILEITSLSALEHIAEHAPHRLLHLSLSRGGERGARAGRIGEIAARNKIKTDFNNHTGGAKGSVKKFEYAELKDLLPKWKSKKRAVVLALDHIQDPQNFGAICRSAEAFGVSAIVIPKERSVSVTPAVYQASVGAVETVPIVRVANIKDALRKLKEEGFWSAATVLNDRATSLPEMPDFEKVVFVLGAEGDGIGQALASECDVAVLIPMSGKIESLNVSVSAAVLLYEFARRTTVKS